jgi:hypothetical protein
MYVSQGAVMAELITFSNVRYAVIETCVSEGCERFVIAYRNEQSLHNMIAAPRIIAFGFFSREEAETSTKASILAIPALEVNATSTHVM